MWLEINDLHNQIEHSSGITILIRNTVYAIYSHKHTPRPKGYDVHTSVIAFSH
jgi:hypothetical protein